MSPNHGIVSESLTKRRAQPATKKITAAARLNIPLLPTTSENPQSKSDEVLREVNTAARLRRLSAIEPNGYRTEGLASFKLCGRLEKQTPLLSLAKKVIGKSVHRPDRPMSRSLLICDRHLVHGNVIGNGRTVAVKLDSIRELVAGGAGEKCIVGNVDGESHAINRKRVMDDGMRRRIVVIFSNKVVPCARSEVSKIQRRRVPALQPVIEDPPLADGIIRLPTEVVNPAVENLLAFKLNGLRR